MLQKLILSFFSEISTYDFLSLPFPLFSQKILRYISQKFKRELQSAISQNCSQNFLRARTRTRTTSFSDISTRALPSVAAAGALTPPSATPPPCFCPFCARRECAGSRSTSASGVARENPCFLGWAACRRGLPASARWTGSTETDWKKKNERWERTEERRAQTRSERGAGQ